MMQNTNLKMVGGEVKISEGSAVLNVIGHPVHLVLGGIHVHQLLEAAQQRWQGLDFVVVEPKLRQVGQTANYLRLGVGGSRDACSTQN